MLAEAWDLKRSVIFCIPIALVVLGALAMLLLRNTFRTRFRMARQLHQDPDINEWLIVFNWSRKVLYIPTIIVSFAAFVIMLFRPDEQVAQIIGGCWLAVFFVNFLIDEYELSIKVLLIGLLIVALLLMWLLFLDWLEPVVRFFRHLGVTMNAAGYLLITLIFAAAVAISWLRGLFYYVAITPNYLNVQTGPTETAEQVSREEYSTRIDTGDFLERLLGFGRLIITFSDQRRPPIILLVSRIGQRARALESIRGILAVDRYQPGQNG